MKRNNKSVYHIIIYLMLGVIVSSCATMRIDPINRAEQVIVTFDKPIK